MKSDFVIGELVGIDQGYNAGIWLRSSSSSQISSNNNNVRSGFLIIIDIDYTSSRRDQSIKVVSSTGLIGWTFASRLKKLE